MSDRLPTALYVDAHLKVLTDRGIYFTFFQKGNASSGLILLKLNNLKGDLKLLAQERDFMTDQMSWISPLPEETLDEPTIDAYIQRAVSRDPDLWVIEIEDSNNPFEDS